MASTSVEALEKRRIFGIISHPDAGKTTLTEKLLYHGGAIREAGSFNLRYHAVKIRSVKGYTGNAVINEKYWICKAVIRSVFC